VLGGIRLTRWLRSIKVVRVLRVCGFLVSWVFFGFGFLFAFGFLLFCLGKGFMKG
jgi:hypothetical protein